MAGSNSNLNNNRRINFWALAAFAGVLFILVLVGIRLFQNDSSPVELGKSPNDFSLTTYAGDEIHTADLRGKVVLVNFWASWCATCDEEAALLEQAWQAYQSDDPERVIFLGVAYMDTEPASRAYLAEYGVTYPNGPDLRGAISKIYQVSSVPETYILDPQGTLRYLKIGSFFSLDEIISAVDAVLALPSN
jgi:cytochrome c biogenesis protein CcmG/thiol:disulfide interchange protein DsbE